MFSLTIFTLLIKEKVAALWDPLDKEHADPK